MWRTIRREFWLAVVAIAVTASAASGGSPAAAGLGGKGTSAPAATPAPGQGGTAVPGPTATATASPTPTPTPTPKGLTIAGFFGRKTLDDDDWPEMDEQRALGIESTFELRSLPVDVAADLFYSSGKDKAFGTHYEGSTLELCAGARRWFELGRIRPYVGGGLLWGKATQKVEIEGFSETEDEESGVGFWAGAGAAFALTSSFQIGATFRYSSWEVELEEAEIDVEAGGTALGVTASLRF